MEFGSISASYCICLFWRLHSWSLRLTRKVWTSRSTVSGMRSFQSVSRALAIFSRSLSPLFSFWSSVSRAIVFFLARSPPLLDDDNDCDDHTKDSGPSLDDNFIVPRSCRFFPLHTGCVCVCVHPDSKLRDLVRTCWLLILSEAGGARELQKAGTNEDFSAFL